MVHPVYFELASLCVFISHFLKSIFLSPFLYLSCALSLPPLSLSKLAHANTEAGKGSFNVYTQTHTHTTYGFCFSGEPWL